jgi:hypothetical protein
LKLHFDALIDIFSDLFIGHAQGVGGVLEEFLPDQAV